MYCLAGAPPGAIWFEDEYVGVVACPGVFDLGKLPTEDVCVVDEGWAVGCCWGTG